MRVIIHNLHKSPSSEQKQFFSSKHINELKAIQTPIMAPLLHIVMSQSSGQNLMIESNRIEMEWGLEQRDLPSTHVLYPSRCWSLISNQRMVEMK